MFYVTNSATFRLLLKALENAPLAQGPAPAQGSPVCWLMLAQPICLRPYHLRGVRYGLEFQIKA